jgi:hypothetical protein
MRMVGDRTYRREPNCIEWSFETSMHYVTAAAQHDGGHIVRDTKVDRVLLSQNYTYWGSCGPSVPDHLLPLFPLRRGQKCNHDAALLAELHHFISLDKPLGLVSDPADWDNPLYFKAQVPA